MKRFSWLLGCLLALTAVSCAVQAEGTRLPQIGHAATRDECSACHLAFPPQMLPVRSWQQIMANLSDHFGEDASLADDVRADIMAYLVANAADAPGTAGGSRFLRGLAADAAPLRITETPFWQRVHDEIPASFFATARVKSRANCIACHTTANRGEFFEVEDD